MTTTHVADRERPPQARRTDESSLRTDTRRVLPEVGIPGHQHREIRYIDGSCVECGPPAPARRRSST